MYTKLTGAPQLCAGRHGISDLNCLGCRSSSAAARTFRNFIGAWRPLASSEAFSKLYCPAPAA